MTTSDVMIGTLRARGGRRDSAALRLRLSHLLNTVDLRPAGLPPAAVLVVRRLADPLPGQLAPTPQAIRANPTWEAALRQALDDLCRRAARPQRGRVLGEPDAVLFADQAELLACLHLARWRGILPWWQSALRIPSDSAGDLWSSLSLEPAHVPAVLGYLADWDAVEVIQTLSSSQALDLLERVSRVYGLPTLLPPSSPTPRDPNGVSASLPAQTPTSKKKVTGSAQAPSWPPALEPPWAAWSPGALPLALSQSQEALLGVCLGLQARPSAVRAPGFRAALRHWWHDAGKPTPPRVASEVSDTGARPASSSYPGARPTEKEVLDAKASGLDLVSGPREALTFAGPSRETVRPSAQDVAPALTSPVREGDLGRAPVGEREVPSPPRDGESSPDLATPVTFAGAGVATEVGGVLYLINLMHRLGLPACCESGWGLAEHVSAWGMLELLGRALLSAPEAADPIWRVLAELDGREPGTLPGETYHRTGDGSLPAGWDVPARADAPWRLRDSPLLQELNPELWKWLARILPFVSRRLQAALGLAEIGELRAALLLAPGRLFVTRSHVDLVLSLSDISLPARRAGLDANPGWQPDFGRIITFHFR